MTRTAHPSPGDVAAAGIVPELSATSGGVYRAGPGIGENTYALLRDELNRGDAQIKSQRAQRTIHCLAIAAN